MLLAVGIGVFAGKELAEREGVARGVAVPPVGAPFVPSGEATRRFGFCHTGGGTNCVVDGDTIWMDGENIRLMGFDTPETHEWECDAEKALGDRATQRLLVLVNGGMVEAHRSGDRDRDRYGRQLRVVTVDGRDVGDILIAEGLARPYEGGRRSWC